MMDELLEAASTDLPKDVVEAGADVIWQARGEVVPGAARRRQRLLVGGLDSIARLRAHAKVRRPVAEVA